MKTQVIQTNNHANKDITEYHEKQKLRQIKDVSVNRTNPKKKKLKERLEDFYGLPLDQINVEAEEVDWGSPVGDEIW